MINCKGKANRLLTFFCSSMQPLITDSILPNLTHCINSKLENIQISAEEIMSLIPNLNIGKANGTDNISAHMLILCDDTVACPLNIIYE